MADHYPCQTRNLAKDPKDLNEAFLFQAQKQDQTGCRFDAHPD